jgi:hypothetical protein
MAVLRYRNVDNMEKLRVLKNAENQSDCSGSEEKNY